MDRNDSVSIVRFGRWCDPLGRSRRCWSGAADGREARGNWPVVKKRRPTSWVNVPMSTRGRSARSAAWARISLGTAGPGRSAGAAGCQTLPSVEQVTGVHHPWVTLPYADGVRCRRAGRARRRSTWRRRSAEDRARGAGPTRRRNTRRGAGSARRRRGQRGHRARPGRSPRHRPAQRAGGFVGSGCMVGASGDQVQVERGATTRPRKRRASPRRWRCRRSRPASSASAVTASENTAPGADGSVSSSAATWTPCSRSRR